MWTALMWGGISASAVVIGALAALFMNIPRRVIGWIMAFGTGTLIGAATFELLGDALNDGGMLPTAVGFTAGAVVYTLFDLLISAKGDRTANARTRKSQIIKVDWAYSRALSWMQFRSPLC